MRGYIILLLFIKILLAQDFISKFEYGQMLYENPRGVSCKKCHGNLGEGAFIASFINSKGEKKDFYGADIRNLDFKTFKKHVEKGGKIMPRFYLTNKELEAIYEFIKIVNMPKSAQKDAIEKQDEFDIASKDEIAKLVQNNIEKEKENNQNNSSTSFDDELESNLTSNQKIDNNIFENKEEKIDNNDKNSIISNMFNNLEDNIDLEDNIEEEVY